MVYIKVLLTSLNTKYIHTNLAIKYLAKSIEDICEVTTVDFTINQDIDYILMEIVRGQYDFIGFSTYIWNLEEHLEIAQKLKQINPDYKILFGGPEVSYDAKKLMEKNDFIDYIICGEGEDAIFNLIDTIDNNLDFSRLNGIVYRENQTIKGNEIFQMVSDLKDVPKVYNDKEDLKDRNIAYIETSRGCPFNCEFCLSSSYNQKVRYFPIERAKKDIKFFIDKKVPLVKFIDRTFNSKKSRSLELINYIIENDNGITGFHLELNPMLIDEDYLNIFKDCRKDLFQFEIGVQSTNEKTCKEINRVGDYETIKKVCQELISYGNIHLHLDLIAGLPYEDYESFGHSFDDIYSINPEKVQLGFLKVLKGSLLYNKRENYGLIYSDKPPYEVIKTKWLSYEDIIKLKNIEVIVDKFLNERLFHHSIKFIIRNYYDRPWKFFESFGLYWLDMNYFSRKHSRDNLYQIFLDFVKYSGYNDYEIIENLVRLDYSLNHNNKLRLKNLKTDDKIIKNSAIHDILKTEELLDNELIEFKNIPTKDLVKEFRIEIYTVNIFKLINSDYKIDDSIYYKSIGLIRYDSKEKKSDIIDISKIVEVNEYEIY